MEFRSLIAAVGKQLLQERIHPEQSGKKQDTAVAFLDIGGVNDGVEQQTQRIYKKVALLAFDADSGGSRPSFRDDAAHRFRDDLAHRSEMMSPTIPG